MDVHIKIISIALTLAGAQLSAMDNNYFLHEKEGSTRRAENLNALYKQSLASKQCEKDKCLADFNNYLKCPQSLKDLENAYDEFIFLNPEYIGTIEPLYKDIVAAWKVQFRWDHLRTRYPANVLHDFDIPRQGINSTKNNQTPLFNIMGLMPIQILFNNPEPLIKDIEHMIQLLVDSGAKTDYEDEFKQTVLFRAAVYTNGHRMIPVLVQGHAHVNHQDFRGRTPLIAAAEFLNLDSLQELIKYGADKTLCDKKGNSALKAAQVALKEQGVHKPKNADEIIKLLE